jgi:hypothetical protein
VLAEGFEKTCKEAHVVRRQKERVERRKEQQERKTGSQ